MKSIVRLLLVGTVIALAAPISAAQAEVKIAVINIQQIMRDSSAAKSARDQISAKQKTFQADLTKKEDELQKENQELVKQRSVLAPEAFEKKIREFNDQANAAQKQLRDKKVQLDKAYNQAVGEMQKTVTGIVEEMAKEKGFQIAMPTSELIYAESSMDITQEVLDRLNKKMPTLNVNF